ncbi:hypothetical protein [Nocardioides alcanivorans]|uniref:hypothetical protein n=1 Tax=Nocardioides alcanivorans TaxID=2897352 RepID=UPI001F3ECFBC|nr:hypothetical protein [Nocardioides alcanivorans]
MGEDIASQEFTRADRVRHREKVRQCLDVFTRMLRESVFDTDDPMIGLEIELNLVDDEAMPSMKSAEVLDEIADPDFQTELGQFNVEINVPPRHLHQDGLEAYELGLRDSLNHAEERARDVGAHMVMIGILPTLGEEHLTADALAPNPRYRLLSDQILNSRGEDIVIDIAGAERLRTTADTIIPEAACTSTQLHLQCSPDDFAGHWNAAQAIAGIQLAVGANSPMLLGKELWAETRIPLFEQATDTRSEELKAQGVRPRVWFGERWITSVFDLFEENVRYFPALLPVTEDEDPEQVLADGECRHWLSCGSTTAPSTVGTGLSTTSPRGCLTCGWRTGSWRPARPWSTPLPTLPSGSVWCASCPTPSDRCGRRCPSARPRRTSIRPPATASTPRSTGRAWARCVPPSSSCAGCSRSRPKASRPGASRRRTQTGC